MEDIFETPQADNFEGEQSPGQGSRKLEYQCVDFCPICRTADVMRAALPEEFQDHWHTLQREGLLAARTLLDHYIKHLDARQRGGTMAVEDIPIE